ncbi:MAG TPA: toll/interleukin-1 receptor domain-containing protein [Rhizobiaceae bacterium]|nr:toll/interleukin-1 receptor domain-containing protein [Rhizobiaceae bacterium]
MGITQASTPRDIVFISKATPGDDDFALWLAPRLEAAGYKVFADILVLEAGDRWRKVLTTTLQECACKLLLCCSDATLSRDGVLEELGIGLDLAKTLKDPKFVIPLRLEPFKKVFGMGELQYVDFERGWAEGLSKLLEMLKRQKVPRAGEPSINPNWESYRRRSPIPLIGEPEPLTSNWLRMVSAPDEIHFYEGRGVLPANAIQRLAREAKFPVALNGSGFLTCAMPDEIESEFSHLGRFARTNSIPFLEFVERGSEKLGIAKQDASNIMVAMVRRAWEAYCIERGLLSYQYVGAMGFHASGDQAKLGERIPWGRQGERRSSMLRNEARGHVWQYGVTGTPAFWPLPHLKLKSRVLFAPPHEGDAGSPYDDPRKQHRLRRSGCKGWRNKQWRGRLLAFLELLSRESAFIALAMGANASIKLEAQPMILTSPVSTKLPDAMAEDAEEADESTLGRPEVDEAE